MSTHMIRSALFILALGGANEPITATPPNDECENAIQISGEGVFSFDSTGATASEGQVGYCNHAYVSGGLGFDADVWYRWRSDSYTYWTVDTCGDTTVDTKIAVYDPPLCSYVHDGPIDCDDDGCQFQSRVEMYYTRPGDEFLIRFGTQPGLQGGRGTFRITLGEPPLPPPAPNCYGPGNIYYPFSPCAPRSRWDALNSTRGQYGVIDDFTLEMEGFLSTVCWSGTYLGDDGECERDLVDFFEITYYADDCGAPGEIIAGPFSQEDVTITVDGPFPTYESFPNGAREFEYSTEHDPVPVCAGETYWIGISNSYYNRCAWFWETALTTTGHAIQIDDRADSMEVVRSDMAFCFNIGHASGPVCFPPPDNDDCADALPLTIDGALFDTSGATTDGPVNDLYNQSYPQQCYFGLSDEQVHKDIWYDVVAPCSSGLRLGLCDSSFDTKVAVYEGSDCPPIVPAIACNDDACGGESARQSELHLDVREGAAYKVRIGGFNGDWGVGVLTFDYGPRLQTSLEDFAAFARCFTAPCEKGPCNFSDEPCCSFQDFDGDGDVDLVDFTAFHAAFRGP